MPCVEAMRGSQHLACLVPVSFLYRSGCEVWMPSAGLGATACRENPSTGSCSGTGSSNIFGLKYGRETYGRAADVLKIDSKMEGRTFQDQTPYA